MQWLTLILVGAALVGLGVYLNAHIKLAETPPERPFQHPHHHHREHERLELANHDSLVYALTWGACREHTNCTRIDTGDTQLHIPPNEVIANHDALLGAGPDVYDWAAEQA